MSDDQDVTPPASAGADDLRLRLRHLRLDDYEDVRVGMEAVYAPAMTAFSRERYSAILNRFPEGQICIEDNGRVVAAALAAIVNSDHLEEAHTYAEIIGENGYTTHDPSGDALYGIEIYVVPEYRGMRLGRRLYDARKELCRRLNLQAIVAGGRIPGYRGYADQMPPDEYLSRVKRREIHDPTLTFQLANDFVVQRILEDYLPEDSASKGYATLLRWTNVYYQPRRHPLVGGRKSKVRLGVVQWQMRSISRLDELLHQVEFFVDALSDYKSDFALFPEFFNVPLMGLHHYESSTEAIRGLARHTDELIERMAQMAVSYNINIIAGSMPEQIGDDFYNVAYLLRRDGTRERQHKLHITPAEWRHWALKGGNRLQVFDTDVGRIGILICYDVEFPELGRLLAEKGMQILFVPFWTDTKTGFQRVRHCAQARAIENECYVAISGSVGNLPKVANVDIQYAQSAVFSPSDFAFPHDAIMAESTPNTEMTLIVDLDLEKLKQLRHEGSVRNQLDRRLDLYRVHWHGPDGDSV